MADIAENTLMNEMVFISHEVLAEVVYVLMGVYSISKIDISDMLISLISFENIDSYQSTQLIGIEYGHTTAKRF